MNLDVGDVIGMAILSALWISVVSFALAGSLAITANNFGWPAPPPDCQPAE